MMKVDESKTKEEPVSLINVLTFRCDPLHILEFLETLYIYVVYIPCQGGFSGNSSEHYILYPLKYLSVHQVDKWNGT